MNRRRERDDRSEALAFKRAASCYGLGRYFYNLAEMWVPLNEPRQPIDLDVWRDNFSRFISPKAKTFLPYT